MFLRLLPLLLLIVFNFPAFAQEEEIPASTEPVQLSPSLLCKGSDNRSLRDFDIEFDPLDTETWDALCLDHIKQSRGKYTAGALLAIALTALVMRRRVRPKLSEGAAPEEVFKKLGLLLPSRMGTDELNTFAAACIKKNVLYTPIAKQLSETQLDEMLDTFFIAGSYRLYIEAIFLKPSVFKNSGQTGLNAGTAVWVAIARQPAKVFTKTAHWLEEFNGETAQLQFVTAASSCLASDSQNEKALELILSLTPGPLTASLWETVFKVCPTVGSLPKAWQQALPEQFISQIAARLIREHDSAAAKKLMDRLPRENWDDTAYMASFMLQAELDPQLAQDMYTLFAQKVSLAANPKSHYEAAQYCESTGHLKLAQLIYRKFATEGIKYQDSQSRYETLRNILAEKEHTGV